MWVGDRLRSRRSRDLRECFVQGKIVRVHWVLLVSLPLPLWCANTTVLFQPSSASVGPYPTNALTIKAETQKTELQVQLPLPAGLLDYGSIWTSWVGAVKSPYSKGKK